MVFQSILLAVLLLASAFFSATEAAFLSLHRVELRRLERDGRRTSKWILQMLSRPEHFLASVLVGNTLVNVAISVLTTSLFLRLLGGRGVEGAIAASTVAVLLIGEVTPKTIAVNYAERVSRRNVMVLRAVQVLLGPLIGAVSFLSAGVLRLLGSEPKALMPSLGFTRGELGSLLEGADREGVMTAQESRLAQNILAFGTTRAEEVMTPRVDMAAASIVTERAELEALAIESKHSRIPIYENTIDEIMGYLPTRDLLLHPETRWTALLRPVAIFPERASVSPIFYEMQKNRTPIAIVVNEYGETVGMLTQEDLLEELVGEIYDEFEPRPLRLRRLEPGVYLAAGQLPLEELNEALGLSLPTLDAVTLNGFLTGVLGGIPRPGEQATWGDIVFRVVEASRHRVTRVRIELGPDHSPDPRSLHEAIGEVADESESREPGGVVDDPVPRPRPAGGRRDDAHRGAPR